MRDPRVKIVYVLAVGVAAFVTSNAAILLSLLGLQVALWFVAGLSAGALLGSVRRLLWFVLFIVVSYAFFASGEEDHVQRIVVLGVSIPLNVTGIVVGLLRSSRIVTIILAAQVVQRTGEGAPLAEGLRRLRAPAFLACGLDLVLATLGPREGGGRRRGRGHREQDEGAPERRFEFRRLLKGDVGVLTERLQRRIAEAREHAAAYGLSPDVTNDLVVIGGLSAMAMTVRLLKVMPGVPVAPGHKGMVLIPLYICASALTRSRFGASQYGLVVGVTSFLVGMGKFGPFDILRHGAPGLFVDLVMPFVARVFRAPGALVYGIVGMGAAATRVTALIAAALVVEAPPVFFAFLLPMVIAHIVFGALSGFVTFHLMRWVGGLRVAPSEAGAPAQGLPSPDLEASGGPRAGRVP